MMKYFHSIPKAVFIFLVLATTTQVLSSPATNLVPGNSQDNIAFKHLVAYQQLTKPEMLSFKELAHRQPAPKPAIQFDTPKNSYTATPAYLFDTEVSGINQYWQRLLAYNFLKSSPLPIPVQSDGMVGQPSSEIIPFMAALEAAMENPIATSLIEGAATIAASKLAAATGHLLANRNKDKKKNTANQKIGGNQGGPGGSHDPGKGPRKDDDKKEKRTQGEVSNNYTKQYSKEAKQNRQPGSTKGKIKNAHLPHEGSTRYMAPKGLKKGQNLPNEVIGGEKCYIDRHNNAWKPGPTRTPGEPMEWDVQLSNKGKQCWEHLSRDGKHLNVSMKGKVTHK